MIPLPISDENPRTRTPVVTMTLIFLNCVAWLYELVHGVDLSALDYGAIPAWILHHQRDGVLSLPDVGLVRLHQEVPSPWTLVTSMFVHGGWLHLIGNMWFLWVFGDNVEEAMGPVRFLVFYFACGLVAAFSQVFSLPDSTMPMVGASGAIAGVLGAYAMLYPHARVRCLWFLIIFITTIWLPAWLLLGIWFVLQFLAPSGVAWMAHVGGFIAGFLLVYLFTLGRTRRLPPPTRRHAVTLADWR